MRKVSDKTKFCTCSVASPEELKNYWAFYRYDRDKNHMVIGQTMLPYNID